MLTIESTPELVASVYARMDRNLQTVRQRLGRPLGLADKVLLSHLDDPAATIDATGEALDAAFAGLKGLDAATIVRMRREKFMAIGRTLG